MKLFASVTVRDAGRLFSERPACNETPRVAATGAANVISFSAFSEMDSGLALFAVRKLVGTEMLPPMKLPVESNSPVD